MFVVGHRGAAGIAPENTLRGFRTALALGVDFVECDVHLTRDGHLVVIHDERVDRTTNGQGRVGDLSLEAIRALDAGHGERVPLLSEVLAVIKNKTQLLCELKGEGTEAPALQAVREADMLADVIFTSFHLERLERVKQLEPQANLGAIFSQPTFESLAEAKRIGAHSVGIHYKRLTPELVAEAHRLGLVARGWNPDTAEEMRAVMALGVDGIGTNRPDILLQILTHS